MPVYVRKNKKHDTVQGNRSLFKYAPSPDRKRRPSQPMMLRWTKVSKEIFHRKSDYPFIAFINNREKGKKENP